MTQFFWLCLVKGSALAARQLLRPCLITEPPGSLGLLHRPCEVQSSRSTLPFSWIHLHTFPQLLKSHRPHCSDHLRIWSFYLWPPFHSYIQFVFLTCLSDWGLIVLMLKISLAREAIIYGACTTSQPLWQIIHIQKALLTSHLPSRWKLLGQFRVTET